MHADALFDLLPDFGARPSRAEPVARPHPAAAPAAPPVDTDALIAAAVARAEAELEARLTAAHQAELEAERRAHADETSAFLATLGDDVGKTIGARLESQEGRVAELVGDQAARILGSILADELQQRSLTALARIVRETMADAEAMRVRVSGPLSLYEALREALGAQGNRLDFTEAPGFDLSVTIDDAIFETRMSEWSQALTEILA